MRVRLELALYVVTIFIVTIEVGSRISKGKYRMMTDPRAFWEKLTGSHSVKWENMVYNGKIDGCPPPVINIMANISQWNMHFPVPKVASLPSDVMRDITSRPHYQPKFATMFV